MRVTRCCKKLFKIYLSKDTAIKPKYKLNKDDIDIINARIITIQSSIPNVRRKSRSFVDLERFKATELRQLLLYTGKIVFKNILNIDYYNNFLILNSAISLLCSEKLCRNRNYIEYAHRLLICFIQRGQILFGDKFLVYNVHSLLHQGEDVRYMGDLNINSAF